MNIKADLRMTKSKTFFTRMKAPVKAKVAEIAKRDNISMSNYIEQLILKDLQRRNMAIEIHEKIC